MPESGTRKWDKIGMGAAGAAAGVVAKTATAPLERVKMLLQVQAMSAPRGDAAARQYRGIIGTLSQAIRADCKDCI